MAPHSKARSNASAQVTSTETTPSGVSPKELNMSMSGMDKISLVMKPGSVVELRNWGYPGYLTEEEFIIFEQFRNEVFSQRRDESFRSTVFSFQKANEEKSYALCRWLRARKYNIEDTIKMVEESTECTADPRKNDFFPCPTKALSIESSLYIKQYPQLYYGHARNGCPLFISQPGMINIDAISVLTNLPKIINFHWYAMMHEYARKLQDEQRASNGTFKRFECVCILDLAGLTASKVGKRELNLIKVQAAIDSLCFPETLNKMVIVNAPAFFTLTWKIIRGWIDQRTSAKVEVIGSSKPKLLKKLSIFIDPKNLPADYGGSGVSIRDFLKDDMLQMAESRREIGSKLKLVEEEPCMVSFSTSSSKSISVDREKFVKLSFLTRTLVGCKIIVKEFNSGKVIAAIDAIHNGKVEDDANETSTRYDLEDSGVILQGKASFEVELVSNGNKRKMINVMMVIKTFVTDSAKLSTLEVNEGQKPLAAINTKHVSICTGVF